MSVVVVIPTYNERKTIEDLLRKIAALRIPELSFLVVDDNSPDGTGVLLDELAHIFPLAVIHRKQKAGLGTAYIEGFQFVLDNYQDCSTIIQMDADFSHDPACIPVIIDALSDSDVVIGSRYIEGGGTKNWNASRRFISRFANWYARFLLRLPYRDLTGGYKAFRRRALENVHLENLSSVGYNFQIEMTWYMHKAGLRITEVPIIFEERREGVSKFNVGIMFESFRRVFLLRFYEGKAKK